MKNISVFGPVVQGRCCFTDIPVFLEGSVLARLPAGSD